MYNLKILYIRTIVLCICSKYKVITITAAYIDTMINKSGKEKEEIEQLTKHSDGKLKLIVSTLLSPSPFVCSTIYIHI